MSPDSIDWSRAVARWRIGQVVEVTVVEHVPFGVFAEMPGGIVGLVENPNLSRPPHTPDRVLPDVGTRLDAAIVDFVERHQQVRLTIRPDHVAAARRGETPWR